MKVDEKINQLCSTIAEHIVEDKSQPPLWPVHALEGYWPLYSHFLKELYQTIKKLEQKNFSNDRIAELFKAPSRLAELTYLFIYGGKSSLTAEQLEDLALHIIRYIQHYRKEDVFCKSGRNIIWTKEQVNKVINYEMITATKERSTILGKINATLWLYTELICTREHQYGHEFHGPYFLPNQDILVVREYYDLKRPEIWPFTSDMKFNKIVTLEIYDKDTKIGFDFFNHTESFTPLPQRLIKFTIGIENYENSIKTISELRGFLRELTLLMKKAIEATKEFSKKDWMKKEFENYFYLLKPHKELLGEEWYPTQEQYEILEYEMDEEYRMIIREIENSFSKGPEKAFEIVKNILLRGIYGEN
ncbi:MAG: hypothetical protein QME61_02285 [Patescibacteria group bacterium]|nr:hypothetical protein [Patescibacteria group bacterium]